MTKKYILLPIILVISSFFVFSGAEAIIAPQIYFTKIALEKNDFNSGEEVKGTFALWNYENYVMGDLVFSTQLFINNEEGLADMLIDNEKDVFPFTLKGGEKSTKSFSYILPSNLPDGEMTLRIQLSNNKGEQLSWIDEKINVKSSGKFLILDNNWILKEGPYLETECLISKEDKEALENGEPQKQADIPDEMLVGKDGKVSPGIGINYNPGEIPEAVFDVSNDSSSDISAYYKLVVYERNFGTNIISEQKGEADKLNSKKKETININLPKIDKPGSYLAEVKYYDETGNAVSNSVFFRWVIAGEGAKILFVKPDKASYLKGETAKIEAEIIGPASFCNSLTGEEIFEVKLFNQNGDLTGESSKNVDIQNQKLFVDVTLLKDVDNPKIEAKLTRNGEVLDFYTYQLNSLIDKSVPTASYILYTIVLLAIIFIAVVVIVLAYYFITKSKNKTLPLLLIIAIGISGILFLNPSETFAAVEVSQGCHNSTVVLTSPLPNQTFSPGDTVRFRGRITTSICVNEIRDQHLNFYITENRDIPIVDCRNRPASQMPNCSNPSRNHCLRSLLAVPSYFGDIPGIDSTWLCADQWNWFCDWMKFVDYENTGYKTHLFASTSLPISHTGNTRIFDYSYTIPSGWSGPVRFYVGFYGWYTYYLDTDMSWWNVLYQPASIAEPKPYVPVGSSRVAKESYCLDSDAGIGVGEGKVDLEWVYRSDQNKNQSSYRIFVSNNSAMTSIVKDFEVSQSGPSGSLNAASFKVLQSPNPGTSNNELGYNKKYYWAVKVKDVNNNWSNMSEVSAFLTPKHPWPSPNFSWNPSEPEANQETRFSNTTSYYETCCPMGPCLPGETPCNRLQGWTFQNGNPGTSISNNPLVRFLSEGAKNVELEVTDTDGYTCSLEKDVLVKPASLNNPPQADIYCSCTGLDASDCNYSSCEFFKGSSLLTLHNGSTDSDSTNPEHTNDIKESRWYIKNQSDPGYLASPTISCLGDPELCNYTPQNIGSYTAKLVVEDIGGLTDEAIKDFKVKRDILADFQCSLMDPSDVSFTGWKDCANNEFKTLGVGAVVYLNDISTPSEGSSISSRTWSGQYQSSGDSVDNFDNTNTPQTFFEVTKQGKIDIGLLVTDTNSRTNSIAKTLGSIPPPKWWPAYNNFSPFGLFRLLLSSIYPVF